MHLLENHKLVIALIIALSGFAGVAAKHIFGVTGYTLSPGEIGVIAGAFIATMVGERMRKRDRFSK